MSEEKKIEPYVDSKSQPSEEHDPLLCEVAAIMASKPANELVQDLLAKLNFEQPKHDGKLDTHNDGRVEYTNVSTLQGIVQGITIERDQLWTEDIIELMPSQALSLLEWLQQNRERLEQLAKEQEG